jgi:hypothetical protein
MHTFRNTMHCMDFTGCLPWCGCFICAKDHDGLKTPTQYLELSRRLGQGELVLIFDGMDEAGEQLGRISRYVGQFLCKNYRGVSRRFPSPSKLSVYP